MTKAEAAWLGLEYTLSGWLLQVSRREMLAFGWRSCVFSMFMRLPGLPDNMVAGSGHPKELKRIRLHWVS